MHGHLSVGSNPHLVNLNSPTNNYRPQCAMHTATIIQINNDLDGSNDIDILTISRYKAIYNISDKESGIKR